MVQQSCMYAYISLPLQAEEVDARILSAIIAGVRRAFPFVATDDVQPLIERHSDALFKMIHTAPFGVAVQALLLLYQLMAAQSAVSDRFYRCHAHHALPVAGACKATASHTCNAHHALAVAVPAPAEWLHSCIKRASAVASGMHCPVQRPV